jgi:hypothetical protein
MVRELRGRGCPASKERVERLMRENGIRARHKRRFKVTTDSKHALPVALNLLDRDFAPTKPNQAWSADIAYAQQEVPLGTFGQTKAGSTSSWFSICSTGKSSAGRSSRG